MQKRRPVGVPELPGVAATGDLELFRGGIQEDTRPFPVGPFEREQLAPTCRHDAGHGDRCLLAPERQLGTAQLSILDFDTVRAYDEDDYRFQEAARTKDDPSYSGKPYRGSLYSSWARLYVEERFTYATLSMAAGYIYMQLESKGQDLLEERIPHRYVPGRHHGKADGDNWQWDMRVDADGQEGVLEELQRRLWDYQRARHEALQTAWDDADRCGVYLVDESKPPESGLHVVFTDKTALSAVRFRSFLRDCRALERSVSELNQAVEEEQAALARFIEEQHADVLQSYDPKVRPLRKKRKVLVAKGAFSGLE
ncbi:MAG TPA: hypothetical protein VEG34_03900 [Thermoanaerobaculia bacterium]|nr:hypothetical protein [Thermoanaerobaculia bacterium]